MGFKVLVTGGAGYLGSVLVPELLKAGHEVTVLDNFMFRQSSLMDCCRYGTFSVERGDARDAATVRRLVADKDFVIPLAALVGAPLCDRDRIGAASTNRDAIKTLCDILSSEQRMVIPITNSGYGIGEKGKFCTEASPLRPVSFYGELKVEAEKIALSRENAISLRLATVFGASPRMRLDLLVNDFTYRAFKDRVVVVFEGHFKRNYIHVRDVAKAFMHAMDNFDAMRGEPYNVGLSDANISKLELCERIRKHVPKFVYLEAPVGEDPDKRDYIVSNEKIESTGYKPDFSLDDGVRELLKAYEVIGGGFHANV